MRTTPKHPPPHTFTIRQVKCGRRMGTKMNINDVSSEHAQINKSIKMERLDHFDAEEAAWQEIVVEDKKNGRPKSPPLALIFLLGCGVSRSVSGTSP